MIAGVSITTLLLVLVAGIGAGFVGYAVGASSLISYPALLAFGIPPVLSNTTNTVGVCGTGIGGLLGVLGGIGMSQLISKFMDTPTALSVPAILVAVVFSVLIGLIFGLVPAVKASKLNPIEALRRE